MAVSNSSSTDSVEVVVLGDYGVGKQSFVVTWRTNSFPESRLPIADYNNTHTVVDVDGETVTVMPHDPTSEVNRLTTSLFTPCC